MPRALGAGRAKARGPAGDTPPRAYRVAPPTLPHKAGEGREGVGHGAKIAPLPTLFRQAGPEATKPETGFISVALVWSAQNCFRSPTLADPPTNSLPNRTDPLT
jgi:hypothetical protein